MYTRVKPRIPPSRRHKYGAKPTYVGDLRFASAGEARRYGELKWLEARGVVRDLRLQVRYPLMVNGQLVTTYVADFVYIDDHFGEVVEDFKGVRTAEYRIKRALMLALHGVEIHETGSRAKGGHHERNSRRRCLATVTVASGQAGSAGTGRGRRAKRPAGND